MKRAKPPIIVRTVGEPEPACLDFLARYLRGRLEEERSLEANPITKESKPPPDGIR